MLQNKSDIIEEEHYADNINCIDILSLDSFINHMELVANMQESTSSIRSFHPAKRVDYNRFCTIMDSLSFSTSKNNNNCKHKSSPSDMFVDATLLWTQIRSFIKGSVEASLVGRPLLLSEYIDLNDFSEERCRLQLEQRREAYKWYEE